MKANDIKCVKFKEPDLNNAVTAVCFLADERVWNLDKFPDFQYYTSLGCCGVGINNNFGYFNMSINDTNADGQTYEEWKEYIGGNKNLFLRELVKNRRFA